MPYVNPLDDTVPADTDLLRDGDDAIREFKDAIIERLLTAFADVDADPLQLLIGAIPNGLITAPKLSTSAGIHPVIYATHHTTTSIPGAGTAFEDISVPGAVLGDTVIANWTATTITILPVLQAYVSAADTVRLYYYNPDSVAVNPAQDIHITVISQTTLGT